MKELSIPDFLHRQPAYRDIYEQYATDAAFLWLLRSIAIEQPHNNKQDISVLEKRIDAQLNGLMTSVDIGWTACSQGLELEEPGEVFTALVVAMRSHDASKIKHAVEVGLSNNILKAALNSALGWLPHSIVFPWITRFLNGKNMEHKLLGLSACSVKRQDPGEILTQILRREECQAHEQLYARALRVVGELRRQDCMPEIKSASQDDRTSIKFWSYWSAILLGHKSCVEQLKPYVFDAQSPFQEIALQLCFRVLPVEQAREWISALAKNEINMRTIIKATGILGDPHAVNWLIDKMQDQKLAKLAGEAFSLITGADLVKHDLTCEQPTQHPLELDEGDIELDEDENLPYPAHNKVATLWRSHGKKFIVGRRYFGGQIISVDLLNSVIEKGNQRQRHAAALELALNETGLAFPNTRAKVMMS